MVCFVLLIPIYVACALFFVFLESKQKRHRMWLWVSCLLALLTVIAFYTWTIIYFNNQYKYNNVYSGMGDKDDDENYDKESKNRFIIL